MIQKRIIECNCAASTKIYNNDRNYRNTYKQIYSNTNSKDLDILILLDLKETSPRFDPFFSACKTLLKDQKFVMLHALGCTPFDFSSKDIVSTYITCKNLHIKKLISQYNFKTIITVGRALYTITESKDLRPEEFFIPVNGSEYDFQLDDTYIYSPEFNCNVYPLVPLYQWIEDSRIKDCYEYKFNVQQIQRAIEDTKKSKTRIRKVDFKYVENPNVFLRKIIDDDEIKFLSLDTETTGLNFIRDKIYNISIAYDSYTGYFLKFSDINLDLLIELFDKKKISMHNCLEANTKILLADGSYKKINEIVKKKLSCEVLCYDENNKIVKSKITNWFKNGRTQEWYKIYFDTKQNKNSWENILITGEHEIYTKTGKILVKDLKVTDKLLYNRRSISGDSFSFFVGSFLGDLRQVGLRKEIQEKISLNQFSQKLKFSHPRTQKKYLTWKHNFLNACNFNITEIQKNKKCLQEETFFFIFKESLIMKKDFRKKIVSNIDAINNLDLKSLAIWYMDDGCYSEYLQKNKLKTYYMSIRCARFTEKEANAAVNKLEQLLGVPFIYKSGTLMPKKELRDFGKTSFLSLIKIAPYMSSSMKYKLPPELYYLLDTYVWKTETDPFYINIKKIEKIEKGSIKFKKTRETKYDIEVEKYHNYIANNIKVSNSSFDCKMLIRAGIKNAKCFFDTMLASHLLNENSANGLKPLTWIYTKYGGYDWKVQRYLKEYKIEDFTLLSKDLLLEYACFDAVMTFQLFEYFDNRFKKEESFLEENFYKFIMPAVEMIVDVELEGIEIDLKYFKEYNDNLLKKLREVEKQIYKTVGKEFNIGSGKELTEVLLSLKDFEPLTDSDGRILKTKNNYLKLDKDTLQKYADQGNEVAKLISEYNHLAKELSQLGLYDITKEKDKNKKEKGFMASMHEGKLYSGYKLHGTETGRASGGGGLDSSINPQNMPGTEEFRKMFLCPKNFVLAYVDYEGMEISIASQISGKGPMETLILEGKDPHSYMGSKITKFLCDQEIEYDKFFELAKVKKEKEYKEIRDKAKTNLFQNLYGATSFGLSKELNISLEEAETFMFVFGETYPEISKYINDSREHSKKYGWVKTLLGRKRRLPETTYIGKDSYLNRQSSFKIYNSLNASQNAPIQGTSGQTTIIAMTKIWQELKKRNYKSKIKINVHDEIVFFISIDELEEVARIIGYWMTYPYYENVGGNQVRLKVEIDIGEVWKFGKAYNWWKKNPEEFQKLIEIINRRNKENEGFTL